MGLDNHDYFSWVIRLIGVHLFRLLPFAGVVRREASPPPLGCSGLRGWLSVRSSVRVRVPYTRRREGRGRTNGRLRKVTGVPSGGRGTGSPAGPPAATCDLDHAPGFGPLVEPVIDPGAALARGAY